MAVGQQAGPCRIAERCDHAGDAAREFLFTDVFSLARRLLLHFPGVARSKKFAKVAGTALGDDVLDLLAHHVFVARKIVPSAENADGRGETWPVLHMREQEGVGWPRVVGVVHHELALRDSIAEL